MDGVFTYSRAGRSNRGMVILGAVWIAIAALFVLFDATPVLLMLLALATLPTLLDLIRNPQSGVDLTATDLRWFTGPRDAVIALDQINHVRLDTRLDFSVRATVVLHSGRRIRIPFQSTPPHQAFEDALTACGVTVKRFHFQLLQ